MVTIKRIGNRRLRGAVAAAVVALLGGAGSAEAASDVATWRGSDAGDWTAGGAWSHSNSLANGRFPNNGGGFFYGVVIGGGGPRLDSAVVIDALTFSSGTISGNFTIDVNQASSWTGGMFLGGTIRYGGDLSIGGGFKRLRGTMSLASGHTTTWTGGEFQVSNFNDLEGTHDTLLTNNGTFDIRTDDDITGYESTSLIVNNGTFVKSAGTGVTNIFGRFQNNGTVTANTGTIRFHSGSGTHIGSFRGPGKFVFVGSQKFNAGSSVNASEVAFADSGTSDVNTPAFAPGKLTIGAHTLRVNQPISVGAMDVTDGFAHLGGNGSVTVAGALHWSGGFMEGTGLTFANGGMMIDGAASKGLSNFRVLHNPTLSYWGGGDFLNAGNGRFENELTGTLEVSADVTFNAGIFNNAGLLEKLASPGTTSFAAPFNNSGTVRVLSGTLSFDGGGNQTGSFASLGGGNVLRFGGGTHTFAASSSINHPHVVFSGGTIDFGGTWTAPAGQVVDVAGATLNFNTPVPLSPAQLNVSGGAVNLSNGRLHQPATLNLSGGAVQGSDALTVPTLNWSGGALSGTGMVTVGVVNISGNAAKTLGGTRELRNTSLNSTWTGDGNVVAGVSAVVTNPLGTRIRIDGDGDVLGGTFNNGGALEKNSGGSGTAATSFTGVFNNSGTVAIGGGALSLEGSGTHAGTFAAGAGALRLAGTQTFTGASHILGPSSITVTSGTSDASGEFSPGVTSSLTVNGGIFTIHNGPLPHLGAVVNVNGGTLDLNLPGNTSLDQSGTILNVALGTFQGRNSGTYAALNFTGGAIGGIGTVRANLVKIESNAPKQITGSRELVNQGPLSYWAGNGDVSNADTAVFTNSNRFEIRNAATFGGGTFNNSGMLVKTSSGTSTISATFNNSGVVSVERGELKLQGSGVHSGSFVGGGRLRLMGTTHGLGSASAVTVDEVVVNGPNVTSTGSWGPRTTTLNGGSLTLSGPQNYPMNAALTVDGGLLNLNSDAGPNGARLAVSLADAFVNATGTQHLRSLTLGSDANVSVNRSKVGAPPVVLVTQGLSIPAADARLDLSDNALVVDYDPTAGPTSPLTTVRALVLSGYDFAAAPHWQGHGITSLTAAGVSGRALGFGEASAVFGSGGGGTFLGEPVDGSAVLVRYTLTGDANLDGRADFSDLVHLAQNYNTSGGMSWVNGDFNYDQNVDFADLVLLAQNYNGALPGSALLGGAHAGFSSELAAAFAAVPEPGGLAFVGICVGALTRSRRGRRKVSRSCSTTHN